MASKKTAKLEQLAQARAQRSNAAAASSTSMSTLESERVESAQILKEIKAFSDRLADMLVAEQSHSQKLYTKFRVERRARQRGQKRLVSLETQIKQLKSDNLKKFEDLKMLTVNASHSVDALLKVEKENTTLR